jgi:exopolysaccharide biosynthesis polyprenyl glycosylphosphotransferase
MSTLSEIESSTPPGGVALASFHPPTIRPAPVVATADADTPAAVLKREGLYRRLLAVADVLATAGALVFSVAVVGQDEFAPAALVALPVVVLVSKVAGLYDRDELVVRKTTLDEAPAIFQVAAVYTLLVWLLQSSVIQGTLGTFQVLGLWVSLFVAFVLTRDVARRLAHRRASVERCLVVGSAATAEPLRRKLELDGSINAAVVGCLALPADDDPEWIADLRELIGVLDVHRVIVAPHHDDAEGLVDVVGSVDRLGVRVSVLPRIFEVVGSSVEFDPLGGFTLLGVRRFGLTRSSEFLKRTLDVVLTAILLVLLAPFLAAIALVIKLQSPGLALFRQTRVGRDGEPFMMLKFRTMADGAEDRKRALLELNEAKGLFKIADDPRTTPIGRRLRKFSLDELPQLFNVLRGEMSLVGPRPLVADEDRQVDGLHRRRLQLQPGVTGPWQLLGPIRIPLREMATIDYLYAANWSLWLDIKILLRTVPHVLGGHGL